MEKRKDKKKHEPWYLMYLFLIPLFLIAIVPEGFFTWQVMIIFAVIMSIPFLVMWYLAKKEPETSNADSYIESLKRNNELMEKLKKENQKEM